MSSASNIFAKSNLVYIPLSITIAHTLNFIINSPSSTWQEFPPKLPDSVYSSVFFTPLLLFISLTFEPIQTRKRFYTLLSLALIFSSIPISYRGGKYPTSLQKLFVSFGLFFGLKMLLFLKFNRAYLNQTKSDQKKEFKSYLYTLFNWRLNSYIIPPNSENSSLIIIKSPTTLQINEKLINSFIIITLKWLVYELTYFTTNKYVTEIPETAYQIRLVEFITKGIPPITMISMIQCLSFIVFVYSWISLNYDIFTIIITIFFRLFFHSASEKNNYNTILIRTGLLTPSEYVSLSQWMITFIFNTKPLFNEPWLSSSPREFWSVRWQLILNEIFKELGFLPVRNLFIPIVPRKIANMLSVLGALGVSALLHEYIIIGDYDIWTGENFFFFMIHGVIFIMWEAVFGYEKKNEITKIKRILRWVLLAAINLLVLPALLDPARRKLNFSDIPSFFSKYYM